MASVSSDSQMSLPIRSATNTAPHRVVKRPARGFHRFRSGILNVTPKGVEREMVSQNQNCPLLRLPTEIRECIWEYVLGGKTFLATCFSGRYYSGSYRFAPSTEEARNGMALLRVCRQIYSEAVLYPFANATFAYDNIKYLRRSIKVLHAYQRKHVTHLRIDCRKKTHMNYIDDSALLSNDRLYFKSIFPALARITVLVHETSADCDSDRTPIQAVRDLPYFLHQAIKATGALLDVASTRDGIEAREVNEMDNVDEEVQDKKEDEEKEEVGELSEMNKMEDVDEADELDGMFDLGDMMDLDVPMNLDVGWDGFVGLDWDMVQGQIPGYLW